jgi:DNA-binding transcriptional MocR family regulator
LLQYEAVSIPEQYWASIGSAGEKAAAVVDAVERAVADGAVAPGDRLPTVRQLASRLGISPTTVAAAYRRLADRGTVIGRGRLGTRVAGRPPLPARPVPPIPPGMTDLAHGNPDPRLLPDLRAVLRTLAPPPVAYGEAQADVPALVEGLTAELRADGIPARRVVVTAGALDAIERVLAARLRPGDRVAVEDPGFPRVVDLIAALGLVPVPVAVDDAGPRPEALARACTGAGAALAAVITPRAQNPTGAALDERRTQELRRVLRDHPDLLVIEDDHAGPIAGAPARSLITRDRRRWAVTRSVAKSLGPDLRLAGLTGDQATLDRVEGRLRLGPGWVSHLLQHTVAELRADPATTTLIERAATTYTERRTALLEALDTHGIAASGATGLNVWVPVPEEDAAIAGLATRGWAVAGGERFRLATGPAVRITVASLPPASARRLAADVAAVLRPTSRPTASA